MNVSHDRADAVINKPFNESNRRLGCVPLPLPANADRPRHQGHRVIVGIHHRGLHSADRRAIPVATNDPVEPSLHISPRTGGPRPIAVAKVVERRRFAAGEFVQRRIGQYLDHLRGIIDVQRSEQQPIGHNRRDIAQGADSRTITVALRLMCCTQVP